MLDLRILESHFTSSLKFAHPSLPIVNQKNVPNLNLHRLVYVSSFKGLHMKSTKFP